MGWCFHLPAEMQWQICWMEAAWARARRNLQVWWLEIDWDRSLKVSKRNSCRFLSFWAHRTWNLQWQQTSSWFWSFRAWRLSPSISAHSPSQPSYCSGTCLSTAACCLTGLFRWGECCCSWGSRWHWHSWGHQVRENTRSSLFCRGHSCSFSG